MADELENKNILKAYLHPNIVVRPLIYQGVQSRDSNGAVSFKSHRPSGRFQIFYLLSFIFSIRNTPVHKQAGYTPPDIFARHLPT
jgi:hypothetical protein